jgi:hypothetical protein
VRGKILFSDEVVGAFGCDRTLPMSVQKIGSGL